MSNEKADTPVIQKTVLSTQVFHTILNYIAQRPYTEVRDLMEIIIKDHNDLKEVEKTLEK